MITNLDSDTKIQDNHEQDHYEKMLLYHLSLPTRARGDDE